ncbi:MAG TPA: AI-2E family transporter [Sphingomicrobium sp.]|nr:AI-2E family transporter [Sphingomicrobium sp.]
MSPTRPVAIAQVITGAAAAMALLYFLAGILIPLVIAFVLVVLVDAVVTFIDSRWPRAPRWAVSVLAGLTVILLASSSIFTLAQGAVQMVEQGPALVARVEQLVQSASRSLGYAEPLQLSSLVGQVSLPEVAGFILSAAQGVLGAVILIIVYFGFLVSGRRRISRKVDAMASSLGGPTALKRSLQRIAADLKTYLWVQTLTGIMLSGSSAVVMWAVGLDNVLFWTVVLFLLSFIPMIGVTIGSVVPALFALLQFPTIWPAAAVFGGIQLVAFFIGNLIYPRMQADTQNIDPVVTLLALAFWTFLWGVPGAFLAVPMTLMVMMVFAQFESTRWAAAALSNDGNPDFQRLPEQSRPPA